MIFKSSAALFIISIAAAISLSFVHEVTLEPIALRQTEAEAAAIQTLFPESDTVAEVDITDANISRVLSVSSGNSLLGWAVFTSPRGYGGPINMMVGIDTNGVVKGVQILSHTETPGLGANASQLRFKDQYLNKSQNLTVTKAPPGDNEIQAITSATITSRSVTDGVNHALAFIAAKLIS
jgi:electron transport complex protein RnfG